MRVIYLHGMGASPNSKKAQFFAQCFYQKGLEVTIPDYNLPDFRELTVSRMVKQTLELIHPGEEFVLIGSSLGGLAAVHTAQQALEIKAMILLAPAFGLAKNWLKKLGEAEITKWQQEKSRDYFHHDYNKNVPLNFEFYLDAQKLEKQTCNRHIPTFIFHGIEDSVVPYEVSIDYLQHNRAAQLMLLHADHQLTEVMEIMWQYLCIFLKI